jgi:aminobenzoyl-glutamate transport protein
MSRLSPATGRLSVLDRFLGGVERLGNAVPNPMVLFAGLFAVILVLSAILAGVGVQVSLPGKAEPIAVQSALAPGALVELLTSAVSNFVTFPALGPVLVVLLGVGVAQGTGALEAAIRLVFSRVPHALVPYVVALVAAQGHVMSDASMVVIPPLAALVFLATGRHPIAGLLGSFAVTASGYGGGLILGTLDVSFAGITQKAAALLPGGESVPTNVAMNYFFAASAGLVLPLAGGLLIDKVLEPRLGPWKPAEAKAGIMISREERRAVLLASSVTLAYVAALITAWLLPSSPLRGPGGSLVPSPMFQALPIFIAAAFFVFGYAYARFLRTPKADREVLTLMQRAVAEMASFIVLMFVISQTLAVLEYSNLATVLAVKLSGLIESMGIGGFGALFLVVVISSILNMLITSGAGLWSLESAVMVPALMLLGLSPAVITSAHRIGDSVTAAISPMTIYVWLVLTMAKEWEPDIKLGTFVSRLLPFPPVFFTIWTGLLAVFYFADIPPGPGMEIHLGN